MLHRTVLRLALCLFMLAAVVFGARAGTRSEELVCWYHDAGDQTFNVLKLDQETTATTTVQAVGYQFGVNNGNVIECSFHVPWDYDNNSGTEPQVRLSGWPITIDGCSGGDETVQFSVTSRAFADGETLNTAWPTEITGTATLTCVTNGCSLGINCILPDILQQLNVDAAASAGDWVADEFVYLKIRRNSADTFDQIFHLAGVELIYPTP